MVPRLRNVSLETLRLTTEHTLGPVDSLLQTILKGPIVPTLFDMIGDRRPNHLGDGLVVDRRDRFECLSLIGGEANRHRLRGFHGPILPA